MPMHSTWPFHIGNKPHEWTPRNWHGSAYMYAPSRENTDVPFGGKHGKSTLKKLTSREQPQMRGPPKEEKNHKGNDLNENKSHEITDFQWYII